MDAAKQIENLRKELNRHNYNYYVLNAPEISDRDFDMMMKELRSSNMSIPNSTTPTPPPIV